MLHLLLPAAGAVPLLVLCVQEPELSLKRVAASALSDIAKHTPELAQVLVDAGAVSYLAPLLVNQDAKLKRQVRTTNLLHVLALSSSVLQQLLLLPSSTKLQAVLANGST
jgi:hypothetical protein